MLDQKGDSVIYASTRLSAKVDLLPLKDGKISVSSAQLFGLRANIYKRNAKSGVNIQFVLDSLPQRIPPSTSRSTCASEASLSATDPSPTTSATSHRLGVFSPQHIGISNLSAHIALHHLTDNDIHLSVRR